MLQQKANQTVYQTSDTQKMVIFFILFSYLEELFNLKWKQGSWLTDSQS